VFDLDAGPVTITLPEAGKRFMSMQIIDEDQYVPEVVYRAGSHTYAKEKIGTRYVLVGIRILVDPNDRKDVEEAHRLQDAIKIEQANGPGSFDIPNWDTASQEKVRDALLVLAGTIPDTKRMFGSRTEVDPVRHLIGTATGWGGNPEKDAMRPRRRRQGGELHRAGSDDRGARYQWRKAPPIPKENVMRGRVMMILASAVLAGSLLATDAQARGGGGGGHGGGGGGGHMGGGGGGHMGGFGGGHIGGFGAGHIGGFGGGRMGGFGGGHIAGMHRDHFGYGRRHFVRGGLYGYGLDCPYYQQYSWPYTCTY